MSITSTKGLRRVHNIQQSVFACFIFAVAMRPDPFLCGSTKGSHSTHTKQNHFGSSGISWSLSGSRVEFILSRLSSERCRACLEPVLFGWLVAMVVWVAGAVHASQKRQTYLGRILDESAEKHITQDTCDMTALKPHRCATCCPMPAPSTCWSVRWLRSVKVCIRRPTRS